MKILSSRIHGVADYVTGGALLLAPYLFGFAELGGAAVVIPQVIGALIIGQSLMTRYELSLFKIIPLKTHLMLDYGASLFLAISPMLFGFMDESINVWLPHMIVGFGYFVISVLSKNEPDRLSLSSAST